MNNRRKIKLAVFIVFIAFLVIYISILGMAKGIENLDISFAKSIGWLAEGQIDDMWQREGNWDNKLTEEFEADTSQSVQAVAKELQIIKPELAKPEVLAKITINTKSKSRTYDVVKGVDEKTLKKNIGWLPSSALPGKEGVCVLMGHRDTDFKILKHCAVGDTITFELSSRTLYNYKVSQIEIIDNDKLIKFDANSENTLVLATCYPFYYAGSAPRIMIVISKLCS